MKNNFTILMLIILSSSIIFCTNNGDNFVGKWVYCDHPETSFIISRKGEVYNLNYGEHITELKKTANEVLYNDGTGSGSGFTFQLTVRYDKSTNHLIWTGKENSPIEFCKNVSLRPTPSCLS